MKIFVKQNSEYTYINYPLNDIIEKYNLSDEDLQNCVVTFSLYDKINKQYVIANKSGLLYSEPLTVNLTDDYNYFAQFKLKKEHTQLISEYLGEFKIDFFHNKCGVITVPEFEYLRIFVTKSITKTTVNNQIIQQTPLTNFPAWYYGTYEVLGGNVIIPSGIDIDLNNGNVVTTINSNNNLNINFNSSANDFIWFAIPTLSTSKNSWYLNQFSFGNIGGVKNINGNLFPDPETITFNGNNYKLYISNYRVTLNTITINNE